MSPDKIRIIAQLRHDFYMSFSLLFDTSVYISRANPYCTSSSKASWTDKQDLLNYICIYAYTAPDSLRPLQPFILRIGVNEGGSIDRAKDNGKLNQKLRFSLTLLPEEVMDFSPWLAKILTVGSEDHSSLPTPPFLLDQKTTKDLLSHGAWTLQASALFSQSLLFLNKVNAG